MIKWVVVCFVVGSLTIVHAQVPNNSIKNRFHLLVDDVPVSSTTRNSSVEWQCINKALTNKCLVYHNDQWFSFVAERPDYYLNLSQQECEKKLGLQFILIEGNPCETASYKIQRCIDRLALDDTFIKLDSLKAGVTYLINIDGFLEDYCEFSVQLSSRPRGFPQASFPEEKIPSEISLKKQVVKITWVAELQRVATLSEFKAFRTSRSSPRAKLVNQQPIKRNTYGSYDVRYSFQDTLTNDELYTYKIFGIQKENEEPILMTTEFARYQPEKVKIEVERELLLSLNYPQGQLFSVMIFDAKSNEQLFKHLGTFDPQKDTLFKADLGKAIDQGVREFLVIITDFSTRGALERYYSINRQGKFVLN
ncbi:MAG: hypothetical protein K2U26_05980 [Cyclobacteriaceae bacterium]|nr:hypothetical protein [Cyclobacteriaceae bacterium]